MNYSPSLDPNVTAATAASIFAVGAVIWLFVILVGLVSLGLWIWALVDVIKRQFPNHDDKNLWMILVIVGLFVAMPILPIVYLIVGRKKGTLPK